MFLSILNKLPIIFIFLVNHKNMRQIWNYFTGNLYLDFKMKFTFNIYIFNFLMKMFSNISYSSILLITWNCPVSLIFVRYLISIGICVFSYYHPFLPHFSQYVEVHKKKFTQGRETLTTLIFCLPPLWLSMPAR